MTGPKSNLVILKLENFKTRISSPLDAFRSNFSENQTLINPSVPTHKMVKHTQTIGRLLPTNCFSVFDHFMGLALKGLLRHF